MAIGDTVNSVNTADITKIQRQFSEIGLGGIFTKDQIAGALKDVYSTSYGQEASRILGLDIPLNAARGAGALGGVEKYTAAISKKSSGAVPLHIAVLARLFETADPESAGKAWKPIARGIIESKGGK